MIELLQLTEALLLATAVTITVVAAPAAIITGQKLPDITPLMEDKIDESGIEYKYLDKI